MPRPLTEIAADYAKAAADQTRIQAERRILNQRADALREIETATESLVRVLGHELREAAAATPTS
jgi:hypothetical protein